MVLFKFKMSGSNTKGRTLSSQRSLKQLSNQSHYGFLTKSNKKDLVSKLKAVREKRTNNLPCLASKHPNSIKKPNKANLKLLDKSQKRCRFSFPLSTKAQSKRLEFEFDWSSKSSRRHKQERSIEWDMVSTSAASSASTTASVINQKQSCFHSEYDYSAKSLRIPKLKSQSKRKPYPNIYLSDNIGIQTSDYSRRVLKKKTFQSEDYEDISSISIKLKGLKDPRKKEEFMCLDEWDLPNLFKDPVLTNQKMIDHVNSNIFH